MSRQKIYLLLLACWLISPSANLHAQWAEYKHAQPSRDLHHQPLRVALTVEECDPAWDGSLFGALPGMVGLWVGVGILHQSCDETDDCMPYIVGGAALGVGLGALLDYMQCHRRAEDLSMRSRKGSFETSKGTGSWVRNRLVGPLTQWEFDD